MISRETPVHEYSFPVEGKSFNNAGRVSTQIKALLKNMNLSREVVRRAALVSYEAEINMCCYAEHGRILLRVTPRFVIIEAIDEGQGIEDIELAMKEGYSTATPQIREMGFGAGMGLANMKNFSDTFRIISEPGKGTHLKMLITIDKQADTLQ